MGLILLQQTTCYSHNNLWIFCLTSISIVGGAMRCSAVLRPDPAKRAAGGVEESGGVRRGWDGEGERRVTRFPWGSKKISLICPPWGGIKLGGGVNNSL